MRLFWRAVAALLLAALLAGCSGSTPASNPGADPGMPVAATNPATPGATTDGGTAADHVELTVFAAASLRDAFGAAKASYEASHPGVAVTFSFDGSGALRTQLEQGAPADLFASADEVEPPDAGRRGPCRRQPGRLRR